MQYFILLPGDSEKDTILDSNLLGESSLKSFYPASGLRALLHIVDHNPEVLPDVRIITDKGQKLSVEEFLNVISKMRVYTG
jgi:hypothetical protein